MYIKLLIETFVCFFRLPVPCSSHKLRPSPSHLVTSTPMQRYKVLLYGGGGGGGDGGDNDVDVVDDDDGGGDGDGDDLDLDIKKIQLDSFIPVYFYCRTSIC